MKKTLTLIVAILIFSNLFAQKHYLKHNLSSNNYTSLIANATYIDSCWYVSPSYAFDFFSIENQTGKYKVGVSANIGYGVRYKPKVVKSEYLCALDLYVGGNAENEDNINGLDYFNIDIIPAFSVYNFFSIGYGFRFKRGLNGNANINRTVLTFGIRKTF